MKKAPTILMFSLLASFCSTTAWAGSRASEQQRVTTQIASASYSQRIDGLRDVCFSGLTSESFFDALAAKFKAQWDKAVASGEKDDAQEAAWMVKALACSGNPKYLPVMQGVGESSERHMRAANRHVADSIEDLPKYQRWNPVVYSEAGHPAGQSWELTTSLNMLRSQESELSLMGVKRLSRLAAETPAVNEEIEKVLLARYTTAEPADDRYFDDALAWYCRVLGDSGNPKYKATLEKVENDAASPKIRKHAAKALARF